MQFITLWAWLSHLFMAQENLSLRLLNWKHEWEIWSATRLWTVLLWQAHRFSTSRLRGLNLISCDAHQGQRFLQTLKGSAEVLLWSHRVTCGQLCSTADRGSGTAAGRTPNRRGQLLFFCFSERKARVSFSFRSSHWMKKKDAVWLKVQPKDFTPNLYSENSWKKSPSVSVKLRKYSFHKLLVFSQFYSKSRYWTQ